jgi:hypothetical protein
VRGTGVTGTAAPIVRGTGVTGTAVPCTTGTVVMGTAIAICCAGSGVTICCLSGLRRCLVASALTIPHLLNITYYYNI